MVMTGNDTRKLGPEATPTLVTIVGAAVLTGGVLLGVEFLWSLPDAVRTIREAAQTGHLTLGLMATLYGGSPEGGSMIGGLGAGVLTTVGVLLLSGRWPALRSRRHRPANDEPRHDRGEAHGRPFPG